MKAVYIVGGAAAVAVWLAVGLLIAKGPQPEIIVPAEVITKVGPLNISNTLITSWVVMILLIGFSLIATRSMKLIPGGLQNFVEAALDFLLGQVEEIAGRENGRKFFVVVGTIFIYIIISNWFGLLPFFNAIGKFEDVHHHVFHELTAEHPHDLELTEDGTYAANEKFAGWKMDGDGGLITAKPGTSAVDYEVFQGDTPGEAIDRYIVFVAHNFADFDVEDEELEHPSQATVAAAAALLDGQDGRPLLHTAAATGESHTGDEEEGEAAPSGESSEGEEAGDEHAEEEGEGHGVDSPALGMAITGIDFEGSQKFGLVIPYFRGTFSDINNTLAMGLIAFVMIEFWGFQALGAGYLKKFFNLNGIMSFVGILELLSEFIRIISFAFRLFGNIFAGEVLILMLTFLMPFLFVDIIYGLELFVGFIQASVFALLTLVFAAMAVESHDDHGDEHGHDDHGGDGHQPGAAQAHH